MAIDLFSIGKFTVHGYGLMIALGYVVALIYATWQCKKKEMDDDFFFNMAIFVLIFGWLGGKLLFIIVEFKTFLQSPLNVIGSEGFVVYGGIITGFVTIYLYCKKKNKDFLQYIDVMVAAVAINQAFGRIGCFLAGCCYGRETTSWIGVIFPEGGLAPAGVKVLPTQLFSAAGDAILFLVLFIIINNKKYRKGVSLCVYLTGYAIGRAIIECFRADARGNVGSLSTSQFISIFAGAVGLLMLSYILRNPLKTEEDANTDGKSSESKLNESDDENITKKDDKEEDADLEKDEVDEKKEASDEAIDENNKDISSKDEEKK